jgi:CubicO group peptidase (beta-lactamase class C family)
MNELTKKLSAIVSSQLPDKYTSVSYAMTRHGELLAADALGHRGGPERKPVDLQCTYNVASISKIICAVAVLRLAERGKFDLDAPVVLYLPRLYMPDERYRRITLRHCLCHTSGLPGTQWLGFSVSDLRDEHYYDDVYEYLSRSTLKADPGAYAVYCNDGFTLAEMTVAAVTGIPYGEYCSRNITEPIGAYSARLSGMHSPEHPLVREEGRPPELLSIRGGAGYTMNMPDLCKLGQLFLAPNGVISEAAKREMTSPQGRTFLRSDERTAYYGLGWDNVNFRDSDYALGQKVLLKTGNSFQFATIFYVIPKYDAVLAISETHDCRLDLGKLILRLFATAMLEKGTNLYACDVPVPEEIKNTYDGIYLTQNCVFSLRIEGAAADLLRVKAAGGGECVFKDLRWDGDGFVCETGQRFFFEEHEGERYLLTALKGPRFPFAMRARSFAAPPDAWMARVGKRYIVCNVRPQDLVIRDILSGFCVHVLAGHPGIFILSFACRSDSGVYSYFDGCVRAVDGETGRSFLDTPANPSRDALDPLFFVRNGVEYCDVASYRYREVRSLPVYAGEDFSSEPGQTAVFRFTGELGELPAVPEGRRIMTMDESMVVQYDSLFDADRSEMKDGYLLLI